MKRKTGLRLLLVLLLGAVGLGVGFTSCTTTLRPRLPLSAAEAASLERFPLEPWAEVLAAHVDGEGQVDYAALKAGREPLDRFVGVLASVGPESRPDLFPTTPDRLAYYINAYNALVLWNVIERDELLVPGEGKVRFFYLTRFPLDGGVVHLHGLENDVVRGEFDEPRIHFALNCASRGCPRLPAEPFVGEALDLQLALETQRFLHEERNVATEDGVLVLSEIFDWFAGDFPPDPVAWIREQAPDLALPGDAEVRYRPWDWSLNDQRAR